MEIYVLLIEDRHCDVEALVFSDRERAITEAKAVVQEYARFPEDVKELEVKGWEYYCIYSCEGDSVTVLKRALDAAI